MLGHLLHRLLLRLDPERAHQIAKWGMRQRWLAPGPVEAPEDMKPTLFGHKFQNLLGLAAGFDKNGELITAAHYYGFGFLEVGSVTRFGGRGNPRPRLFRLPDGLLNRMGLNGDCADVVAERLRRADDAMEARRLLGIEPTPYGINIAKTHDPRIVGEEAIRDMRETYQTLRMHGLYHVLNISCPNTAEGKTFEDDTGALRELLREINLHDRAGKPLLLKLSPTLILSDRQAQLDRIAGVSQECGINGFVAANTWPMDHAQYGKGGRSGRAVHALAVGLTRYLAKETGMPVIGCGGVQDGDTARHFFNAGASLVQVYSGYVTGPWAGPRFPARLAFDLDHGTWPRRWQHPWPRKVSA